MQDIISFYSPEEINAGIRLVTELILLIFGTSVGTFTRELLFPNAHTFKQNVGFALVSGFIAFGIMLRFEEQLTLERMFLLCAFLGFFVPVFKNWFKDKKIFKIIFRVLNKTSDITSTAISEITDELEKEEDKEE